MTPIGGHILAESEGVDRGTCFKLYFRRDETLPEELEAGVIDGDGTQRDVTGGRLILLVED